LLGLRELTASHQREGLAIAREAGLIGRFVALAAGGRRNALGVALG
jgi:hypothetical protein